MSENGRVTPAESKVEVAKRRSRHLRGTIAETLASGAARFGDDDATLLKFHGTYQQDDRDRRRRLLDAKQDRAWMFMVRVGLPGGELTADQYLEFDRLADLANGTLRVTTRQGLQFHGVLKGDLKATIAGVHHHLATTLAACGDVRRNVMACPAPLDDPAHLAVRGAARGIARDLAPASRAYHEIWLDGEKQVTTEEVEEPFYGDTYLPRKFKIAVALETDNCVDIYSQDVGLVAVVERGALVGYHLLAGGGLGMTHGMGDTVACLAQPVGFVAPDHAVEAVRAVAAVFRDHGNRADRRHARLKYLLRAWGMDRFRDELRRRLSFQLGDPRPLPGPISHDHLGRSRQGEGRWCYGVFIQNGRVADVGDHRLRTALREVVAEHRPALAFTPQQNLLLTGLDDEAVERIERRLAEHGVTPPAALPAVRRFSMACPALPTCGLALAESERLMPTLLDRLEAELTPLGLRDAPITVRMTGCPNGCARPYTADLAFVGRSLDLYNVYVGGGLGGDRVVDLYRADVRTADLVASVKPLLERWAAERTPAEGLGDFYRRVLGDPGRRVEVTGKETPTWSLVQIEALQ